MPRGRVQCIYVTDIDVAFTLWVDRDSVADTNRGWVLPPEGLGSPLGRGVLPRRVVGIDADGFTRYARVATNTAPLWTGAVTTWSYQGTDGLSHSVTRVGRQEERRV